MAIKRVKNGFYLYGLSSDSKPTTVPLYSLFNETDTGDVYMYVITSVTDGVPAYQWKKTVD